MQIRPHILRCMFIGHKINVNILCLQWKYFILCLLITSAVTHPSKWTSQPSSRLPSQERNTESFLNFIIHRTNFYGRFDWLFLILNDILKRRATQYLESPSCEIFKMFPDAFVFWDLLRWNFNRMEIINDHRYTRKKALQFMAVQKKNVRCYSLEDVKTVSEY